MAQTLLRRLDTYKFAIFTREAWISNRLVPVVFPNATDDNGDRLDASEQTGFHVPKVGVGPLVGLVVLLTVLARGLGGAARNIARIAYLRGKVFCDYHYTLSTHCKAH